MSSTHASAHRAPISDLVAELDRLDRRMVLLKARKDAGSRLAEHLLFDAERLYRRRFRELVALQGRAA